MDDVSILELNSRQCSTDLGTQLDALDGGKLTKEAQSRINLAHERLAHNHLWKGRGSRDRRVALSGQIGQPCGCYDGGGQPQARRTGD